MIPKAFSRLFCLLLLALAALGCGDTETSPKKTPSDEASPSVGVDASTPDASTPDASMQEDPASGPATSRGPQKTSDDADILYTLSFDDAVRHLVDVEAVYPAPREGEDLVLKMAVWTPGSYLVREYSRQVEGMKATDSEGNSLRVNKIAKNRWRIEASGTATVRYRIYAREMSVRTNFVDGEIGILNGAPTFLIPADGEELSHEVRLELPDSWTDSATALEPLGEHRYRSADFDTLVDSPILLGRLARFPFEVDGVPHELVQAGDYDLWDHEKATEDVARLTEQQIDFWRRIPYDRYLFLNAVTESGGGLEHKDSTLMLAGRFSAGDPETYRRWLGLVSHELFHAWNVKRLRPAALGPFDYEGESYTRSLWIAEGLTSYYGPLLLRRAGLYSTEHYLEALSRAVEGLQESPGRRVRSVADASFDAWIKGYRPDENTRNTSISYYGKGSLVGWLLDAEIRRRTTDRRSLDDVMRLAYERYAGDRGFTPEDFRRVVAEVAGEPLDDFFDRFVDGVEELDYRPALDHFGLRFRQSEEEDGETEVGYLGAVTDGASGRFLVVSVPRDTPAWEAGLQAEDEILAIDAYRVDAQTWEDRLKHYPPGTETSLWISRRGRLQQLPVVFAEAPRVATELEVDSEAGSRARQRRAAWLSGRS